MNLNGKVMAIVRDEFLYQPNRDEAKLIGLLNTIQKSSKDVKSLWTQTLCLIRKRAFRNWAGSAKLMEAFVATDPKTTIQLLTQPEMYLPADMLVQVLQMKHSAVAKVRLQVIETASYLSSDDPNRKALKDYAVENIPAAQVGVIRTLLSSYSYMLTEDEIIDLAENFAKKRSMIPVPWVSNNVVFNTHWSLNLERILKKLVELEKKYYDPEAKGGVEDTESELFTLLPSERLALLTETDEKQLYKFVQRWVKENTHLCPMPHVPEFSFNPKLGDLVRLLENEEEQSTLYTLCPSTTVMRAIVENICIPKNVKPGNLRYLRQQDIIPPVEEVDAQLKEDIDFLYSNLPAEQFFTLLDRPLIWGAGSPVGEIARAMVMGALDGYMAGADDSTTTWEATDDLSDMAGTSTLDEILETAAAAF